MPDPRVAQLQSASFRGVSFLVPEETKGPAGNKIKIHDYPNSGKRFAQNLGPLPPEFGVIAIITGDDFLQKVRAFERVLSIEGPGRLVLPHQGALTVVALPYKVNYQQKRIGVVTLQLRFTISNTDEVPAQAPTSVEDVYQTGDESRQLMQETFENDYIVPKSRANILTTTNDFRRAVVDTVQDYSANISIANSKIQKVVRDVQTDLATLIRDPQDLAKKLIFGNIALVDGLLATISALFSGEDAGDDFVKPSASDALNTSDFGSDFTDPGTDPNVTGIPLWPEDTGDRIIRNANRSLIVNTVRTNSMILAFESAANFDFETSIEISSTVALLENSYTDIVLSDDPSNNFTQDSEFKILLDTIRSQTYAILEQKSQQVYSIADFLVRSRQSIMNLTYKLYAEELDTPEDLQERAEDLVALNPDLNPTSFSGEIKIAEVA